MTDGRTPTRTERLSGEVAEAILSGEFPPGSRLDEQMLAARFGVSRTPVREVLRELAASGLVEQRPRRGAVVAQVTQEQLDTLFGAMAEIEGTCARLSARAMTLGERRRLELLHERMADLVTSDARENYVEANLRFHGMIYDGCHNSVLGETAVGLRRRVAPFRRAQFQADGRLARSHGEHGVVVAAILAADPDAAYRAMVRHVVLVEEAVEQHARARGAGAPVRRRSGAAAEAG